MEVSGQFHAKAALPRGKSPRYPLECLCVGTRAGLDAMAKKNLSPARNRTSVVQPVAYSLHSCTVFIEFWKRRKLSTESVKMKVFFVFISNRDKDECGIVRRAGGGGGGNSQHTILLKSQ
jgi:hypothetical protein